MTRRIVLLLANPASYRLTVFREAAVTIGLEPVVGYPAEAGAPTNPNVLSLDFADPARAAAALGTLTEDSVSDFRLIAVDDTAVELAANLNQLLNLPGNSVDSAHASRDKITMRRRFAAAGLPDPEMHPFDPSLAHDVAEPLPYPIVVKPAGLNGSRGVIRANDRTEFLHASALLADILRTEAIGPSTETALWERFIPGTEVAIEAMLTDGHLVVLAIFDKPDPLDGPFFEETIYVTPSRLPGVTQEAVAATVAAMADAIGLRHGPIHAEVRINEDGVWPIEIASRSIGGMCATVLEFGAGMSLEELILRHAFGETVTPQRTTQRRRGDDDPRSRRGDFARLGGHRRGAGSPGNCRN